MFLHCCSQTVSKYRFEEKERERETVAIVSFLSATLDPFPIICHQLDIPGHSNIGLIPTCPKDLLL
jgi:hypothetical protein